MLNLTHHNTDFGLDAAWTFTATGHGKGAGDGIGAFLKSTARRATLSKSVHLSSPKDFYNFLKKHQLETAEASGKAYPTVHVFYLEAREVKRIKTDVISPRTEKLKSTGKDFFIFYSESLIVLIYRNNSRNPSHAQVSSLA